MERAALKIVDSTTEKISDPSPVVTFEDFWTLFPRREAKKDATKTWSRMSEADQLQAVVALIDWRRVWHARADHRYTPLPATWLNGERWTDELPVEHRQRPASHAPVAVKADEPHVRATLPQHVLDAIAKIRTKG